MKYEYAVLNAFEEVESNLTMYGEELQSRNELLASLDSALAAVTIANTLYENGLSSFIDVLDSERDLIRTEDALVHSETRALLKLIALNKSLGGGWENVASSHQ